MFVKFQLTNEMRMKMDGKERRDTSPKMMKMRVREGKKTIKLEKTMDPKKYIAYNPLMRLLYHHVSVRGHFRLVCHAVRSKRIEFHKTFVVGESKSKSK